MNDTRLRSYRPGSWYAVLGSSVTVLLPASEKHRVAELWTLIEDGAGFDETLDALLVSGLRELPGFVLVSQVDDRTKVVLRGAVIASFVSDGETVELAGSPGTTWVERSLSGVTRMFVRVEPVDGEHADLRIGSGLVRLSALEEPPPAPVAALEEPPPAPVAADSAPVAEAEAAGASSVISVEDLLVAAEGLLDEPEDPPAPPEPPAWDLETAPMTPAADPEQFPDLLASGLDAGTGREWSEPGTDELPAEAPDDIGTSSVARLTFSSGEELDVDRVILIGRAPESRPLTVSDQTRLVTVPSPNQEISSTHLEVRPGSGADQGSAVATDMGSTNGTVLVQPGQAPEELQPGVAATLVSGAVIDLGDGLTIQVGAP